MDKPTKPSNLTPRSFGGIKNNFSTSLQSSGYEPNIPAIYGGDNLNYQLDATGKELDYCEKIVDFINATPIGKTITVDSNNKLVYTEVSDSNKANITLNNLNAEGKARIAVKEYLIDETYSQNDVVMVSDTQNTEFYKSVVNNNTGNSLSDNNYWVQILDYDNKANIDLDNLSDIGEAKIQSRIPNCVVQGKLADASTGKLDLIDATTSQDYSQTVTYAQPGVYSFTVPQTGNATLELVGGGGGAAFCIYYTNTSNVQAGGGSGAAWVGTVNLTAGTYTIVVGGGGKTQYNASMANATGQTGGDTYIEYNGQRLITAGAGTAGSVNAYGGNTKGQGGVVTIGSASIVSTSLSSNGNPGTGGVGVYGGGGASVYGGLGKGAGASDGYAVTGYVKITYTSTVQGSTTINWNVSPSEPLKIVKPNGQSATIYGVNSDDCSVLADGQYVKMVDETSSELINIANRWFNSYTEPTSPSDGAIWRKIGQPYAQYKYNGSTQNWEEYNKVEIGSVNISNNAVSAKHEISLYVNDFNLTRNYFDRGFIANMAMPSTTIKVFTVGASGTTYTAPANGYIGYSCGGGSYGGWRLTIDCFNGAYFTYSITQAGDISGYIPINAGRQFKVEYANLNNPPYLSFIYAQGEV